MSHNKKRKHKNPPANSNDVGKVPGGIRISEITRHPKDAPGSSGSCRFNQMLSRFLCSATRDDIGPARRMV
jgi:hypothetical protein